MINLIDLDSYETVMLKNMYLSETKEWVTIICYMLNLAGEAAEFGD